MPPYHHSSMHMNVCKELAVVFCTNVNLGNVIANHCHELRKDLMNDFNAHAC